MPGVDSIITLQWPLSSEWLRVGDRGLAGDLPWRNILFRARGISIDGWPTEAVPPSSKTEEFEVRRFYFLLRSCYPEADL